MSSRSKAVLAIILASFTWSTAGVTVKLLLPYFDLYTIAFIRFLLASLFVIPFLLREKHIHWPYVFLRIIPISTFVSLNVLLFYIALTRTTATAASVIYASEPFLIALFSWFILHDRLTKRKFTGILVGFIGVIMILVLPALSKGQQITGDTLGNILVFIGAVIWALYTIGSKKFLERRYSPLFLTAISTFTSTIVFFCFMLFNISFLSVPVMMTSTNILLFINLSLIVTVASFVLFQWAIKHSSPVLVSLSSYLQPIFTTIIAMIVLHEQITFMFVVGSGLVMVGLLIISGPRLFLWIQRTSPY